MPKKKTKKVRARRRKPKKPSPSFAPVYIVERAAELLLLADAWDRAFQALLIKQGGIAGPGFGLATDAPNLIGRTAGRQPPTPAELAARHSAEELWSMYANASGIVERTSDRLLGVFGADAHFREQRVGADRWQEVVATVNRAGKSRVTEHMANLAAARSLGRSNESSIRKLRAALAPEGSIAALDKRLLSSVT